MFGYFLITMVYFIPAISDTLANLALKKATDLSSLVTPLYSADKAVDGNHRNGNDKFSQCAFTGKGATTWWQVDLGKEYLVTSLTITKRLADKTQRNLTVTLHEVDPKQDVSNSGAVCCVREKRLEKNRTTLQCGKTTAGRYLRITKRDSLENSLILCEVEVYGHPFVISFSDKVFHKVEEKTVASPLTTLTTPRLFDCAAACLQTPDCDRFHWGGNYPENVCKLGSTFTKTSFTNNTDTTYYEASMA